MNHAAIQSSAIFAVPLHGVVHNPWARSVLTFLLVFGPNLILILRKGEKP